MTEKPVFIEGKNIYMRPLLEADFNMDFLCWLNDPETNEFSQRRPLPYPKERIREYHEYYESNGDKGFVLAVVVKETDKHIGNIGLVNIQHLHRCAEVTILIGDKEHWGEGYGAEAIYLVTKHGFDNLNLNRIFAGGFNPAFVKVVEGRLGWQREGVFRERIWSNGRYHDQIWSCILQKDFKEIPKYEL